MLKSTSRNKLDRKSKLKPLKDIATAGITAMLGIALVSETAEAVKKI